MNLDQYVGKTVKVIYASPTGQLHRIGFVESSNERMALSLTCDDETVIVPCYRIISIEIIEK